jgi:hypothetical protein
VIWALVTVAVALVAGVMLVQRWRNPEKAPHRITPRARRILFPFVGETVSQSALDASLRLARAEHATLVPAYIATVPLQRKLDAPIPADCSAAMPLLEVIERRAARLHVPVDARIETGRTARHALRRLAERETFVWWSPRPTRAMASRPRTSPGSSSMWKARSSFCAQRRPSAWRRRGACDHAAGPEHPPPPSASANGSHRHGGP